MVMWISILTTCGDLHAYFLAYAHIPVILSSTQLPSEATISDTSCGKEGVGIFEDFGAKNKYIGNG